MRVDRGGGACRASRYLAGDLGVERGGWVWAAGPWWLEMLEDLDPQGAPSPELRSQHLGGDSCRYPDPSQIWAYAVAALSCPYRALALAHVTLCCVGPCSSSLPSLMFLLPRRAGEGVVGLQPFSSWLLGLFFLCSAVGSLARLPEWAGKAYLELSSQDKSPAHSILVPLLLPLQVT